MQSEFALVVAYRSRVRSIAEVNDRLNSVARDIERIVQTAAPTATIDVRAPPSATLALVGHRNWNAHLLRRLSLLCPG
jgi:hypothetical protein